MKPVVLDSFDYGEYKLVFKNPCEVQLKVNTIDGLLCLNVPELGLCVYSDNQPELEEEFKEDLHAMWRNIALEPEENLEPMDQGLKQDLLARIDQVEYD